MRLKWNKQGLSLSVESPRINDGKRDRDDRRVQFTEPGRFGGSGSTKLLAGRLWRSPQWVLLSRFSLPFCCAGWLTMLMRINWVRCERDAISAGPRPRARVPARPGFCFDRCWPLRRRVPRTEAWDVVPDLAIEVVSKTNTADQMAEKIEDYFRSGVRQVWVVYPGTRKIYLYDTPTSVKILQVGDDLEGGSGARRLPGSLWKICSWKEPKIQRPRSVCSISVPAARSSLLTRTTGHPPLAPGHLVRSTPAAGPGAAVHWIETRSATDLDKALLGLACPVVLIDLRRNVVQGLSDLDRLTRFFPGARVLVLDPEAHDGAVELARESGATPRDRRVCTASQVACLIDRWIALAGLQTDRAGCRGP